MSTKREKYFFACNLICISLSFWFVEASLDNCGGYIRGFGLDSCFWLLDLLPLHTTYRRENKQKQCRGSRSPRCLIRVISVRDRFHFVRGDIYFILKFKIISNLWSREKTILDRDVNVWGGRGGKTAERAGRRRRRRPFAKKTGGGGGATGGTSVGKKKKKKANCCPKKTRIFVNSIPQPDPHTNKSTQLLTHQQTAKKERTGQRSKKGNPSTTGHGAHRWPWHSSKSFVFGGH